MLSHKFKLLCNAEWSEELAHFASVRKPAPSRLSLELFRIFKFPGSKNYHANLQFKSHNLKLAYNVKKPWNCVFSGRSKIVEFLRNDLYAKIKVKHDVSTFKADALTMGDTIVATLHGQFSYSFAVCFPL